ncbi:MAG: tRNA pseudouridine(13) synthase TruD, partial [Candidatus Hodarchaeota archaeon]
MAISATNNEKQVGIMKYFIKTKKFNGKIKQQPEDFVVIELDPEKISTSQKNYFSLKKTKPGLFIHFILKKRLIDSPSAINLLARKTGLRVSDFGYAGLKDALAITYQRISVWGSTIDTLKKISLKNMELIDPVPASYQIRLGQLWGNQFQVRITQFNTSISDQEIQTSISELKKYGFPNYFGLQRFGTKRPVLHQVGKYIIKRDYKKAVYTYLGAISPIENSSITAIREDFIKNENFDFILKEFPKRYTIERTLAQHLKKRPNDFLGALSRLPYKIKRLCISSYQSYLFNRILSQMDYSIPNLELPLVGFESKFQDFPEEVQQILSETLEKEKISYNDFKHSIREFSTKGGQRKAFIIPTELFWGCENEETLKL